MNRERQMVEKGVAGLPRAVLITYIAVVVTETPDWEPAFTPSLEAYLYAKYPNAADAKKRLNELENWDWPAEDELAAYEKQYWKWDVYSETPGFYLYYTPTTAPADPDALPETAPDAVYFLCETREYGQYTDYLRTLGPFRTLQEIADTLAGKTSVHLLPLRGDLDFTPVHSPHLTTTLQTLYHATS